MNPADNNTAFIRRLLNKRLTAAAAKGMSIEQIDKAIATLQKVRQQKEEEIAEVKRKQAEEKRKLQEIYDYAVTQGIKPEQMLQYFKRHVAPTAVSAKLPPKYRYIDAAGSVHEWCGRGAAPGWFKALQENTDHYLIGDDGLTNQQRSMSQQQG